MVIESLVVALFVAGLVMAMEFVVEDVRRRGAEARCIRLFLGVGLVGIAFLTGFVFLGW